MLLPLLQGNGFSPGGVHAEGGGAAALRDVHHPLPKGPVDSDDRVAADWEGIHEHGLHPGHSGSGQRRSIRRISRFTSLKHGSTWLTSGRRMLSRMRSCTLQGPGQRSSRVGGWNVVTCGMALSFDSFVMVAHAPDVSERSSVRAAN
jgi:hypothetical protein